MRTLTRRLLQQIPKGIDDISIRVGRDVVHYANCLALGSTYGNGVAFSGRVDGQPVEGQIPVESLWSERRARKKALDVALEAIDYLSAIGVKVRLENRYIPKEFQSSVI